MVEDVCRNGPRLEKEQPCYQGGTVSQFVFPRDKTSTIRCESTCMTRLCILTAVEIVVEDS